MIFNDRWLSCGRTLKAAILGVSVAILPHSGHASMSMDIPGVPGVRPGADERVERDYREEYAGCVEMISRLIHDIEVNLGDAKIQVDAYTYSTRQDGGRVVRAQLRFSNDESSPGSLLACWQTPDGDFGAMHYEL